MEANLEVEKFHRVSASRPSEVVGKSASSQKVEKLQDDVVDPSSGPRLDDGIVPTEAIFLVEDDGDIADDTRDNGRGEASENATSAPPNGGGVESVALSGPPAAAVGGRGKGDRTEERRKVDSSKVGVKSAEAEATEASDDGSNGEPERNDVSAVGGIYDCGQCPRRFTELKVFAKHTAKHPQRKCALCGGCYNNMESHTKYSHRMDRLFWCTVCGSQFKTTQDKTRHMIEQHAGVSSHPKATNDVLVVGVKQTDQPLDNPPPDLDVKPNRSQLVNPVVKQEGASRRSGGGKPTSRSTQVKREAVEPVVRKMYPCCACSCGFLDAKLLINHMAQSHRIELSGMAKEKFSAGDGEARPAIKVRPDLMKASNRTAADNAASASPESSWHLATESASSVNAKKIFSCSSCSWTGNSRQLLLAHLSKVHQKPVFSCETCHQLFQQNIALLKHRKDCGKGRKATKPAAAATAAVNLAEKVLLYPCFVCNKSFSVGREMIAHVEKEHGITLAAEEAVRATSKTPPANKRPLKNCDNKNQNKTKSPSIPPPSRSVATTTTTTTQSKPAVETPCFLCDEYFTSDNSLARHLICNHKVDRNKLTGKLKKFFDVAKRTEACDDAAFLSPRTTTATPPNAKPKPNDGKKVFPCFKCEMTFSDKDQVLSHVEALHCIKLKKTISVFPCHRCSQQFNTKVALVFHLRKTHQLDVGRMAKGPSKSDDDGGSNVTYPYACAKCSGKFESGNKEEMLSHLKLEHNTIPANFGKKRSSVSSPVTALNNNPPSKKRRVTSYPCYQCDHELTNKTEMLRHVRDKHTAPTTSNEQKLMFPCHLCDKQTSDRLLMLQHLRTHHGLGNGNQKAKQKGSEQQQHALVYARKSSPPPPEEEEADARRFGGAVKDEMNKFDCRVCNRTFDVDSELALHMWDEHQFTDSCPQLAVERAEEDDHRNGNDLPLKISSVTCGGGGGDGLTVSDDDDVSDPMDLTQDEPINIKTEVN